MIELTSEQEFYYGTVSEYMTQEAFLQIFNGFNSYEDIPKQFTARDAFRALNILQQNEINDPIFDGIHLVIITSIIELLTMRNEFLSFPEWFKLNKEKRVKKKIMADWQKYIDEHGIGKHFRQFFLDLDKKTKFNILHLVKRKPKGWEHMRPFCYQRDVCDYSNWVCNYRVFKEECPAYKDDKILNDAIKSWANHMYKFRSLFVHEAEGPRFAVDHQWIREELGEREAIDLHSSVTYLMKEGNEYVTYISEFYIKNYYELLMNNLEKTMLKYLDEVRE